MEKMMVKVFDPRLAREALEEAREPTGALSARQVARVPRKRKAPVEPPVVILEPTEVLIPEKSEEERMKEDFRLFLVALWRHLLHCDPAPAMLDMAYWLQHGPDRCVIEAFRGFSKSWITGAYALWLLYRNPQEKILVVSGSLARAIATTNWCLMVILEWPVLAHLKPLPNQRQSSKAFDVGPATPEQSPSFHALGIGAQFAGFRATCIIPDDVETQQNSLTSTMRGKNKDSVKEFDSVLVPGGTIKFLGTPHDEDSLYVELSKRGYVVRIYPALYPTETQIRKYGNKLAPWVPAQIKKLGPSCIGAPIMPTRFTADDLAKRRLSLGPSEFALQFMLDTALSDLDKYPLKLQDLSVLSLDPRKGPETYTWTKEAEARRTDLPAVGLEGDFWYSPAKEEAPRYAPYNRIVAAVDNSGRGTDETSLVILAELNATLYLIGLWASTDGFSPSTLTEIANQCVKYKVQILRTETNYGGGMFATLLRPYLEKAWVAANKKLPKGADPGGTTIEEVRQTSQLTKEKRMALVLEPIIAGHRLVVSEDVVRWDYSSVTGEESADGRHRYSLFHQLTHLTKEIGSLDHDDRLDCLATCVMGFSDIIGVDPLAMAQTMNDERYEKELEELLGDDLASGKAPKDHRIVAMRPTAR